MRLGVNIPILLVALLIASAAFGASHNRNGKKRKKNGAPSGRPTIVVAVVDLKADGELDRDQQKQVRELSVKLREKVERTAKNFKVIPSRQMRALSRKHRRAIKKCYDDCDVEFGLLADAKFVISGHISSSSDGMAATLEIRDTQNRSVVETKQISGADYSELESNMLSSVHRFVKPLNHIVYQAKDDEVIRDTPLAADQAATEDVTGLGTGSEAVTSGEVTQAPSEYVVAAERPKETRKPSRFDDVWDEMKDEPPFLDDRVRGFDDTSGPGIFGIGINAGYSFNVSRAKHLRKLYTPVFHVGAQVQARIHHLLEIAVVADIDYLTGDTWADTRFGTPSLNVAQDEPTNVYNLQRYNEYKMGSYLTAGIRPTVRLVIPVRMIEFFAGVGLGFNYVKTSGYWMTQASGKETFEGDEGVPDKDIKETAVYNFTKSSVGFYSVFELAAVVHAFSKRLGIGALVQLKMPTMWQSGAKTDVDIDESKTTPSIGFANEVSAFGFAEPGDVKNSPIGHLDVLNLLTVGLYADWRF